MKKIILSLFLVVSLPFLLFSQSERMQKQSFRSSGSGFNYQPSQSIQSRPSIGEYQQKQSARNRNSEYYVAPNNRPGRYFVTDPYWGWGWNRWDMWGAPMIGWNYWMPYSYYNDWGYRQPARVYVYKDGKTDTIKGIKPIMSLGIQSSAREVGGFFTVGKKTYFIFEHQRSNQKDKSVFYKNITMSDVIDWKDRKLADVTKTNTTYIGVGKRYKRSGLHASIGINNERVNYQYFDELFVLSNNGNYSFPNYNQTYWSLKLGMLHDAKVLTFKGDYDLTNREVIIGLGINF
jgi:hypothetical protein